MKVVLVLLVIAGLTSGQLVVPDITNFEGIQGLFKTLGESVFPTLSNLFTAMHKDDPMLKNMSPQDIMKNFITNAREALTKGNSGSWKKGLDISLLGLSKATFQSMLNLQPAPRPADGNGTSDGSIGSAAPGRRKRQTTATPTSIDWRSNGAVTPVKNQGQCGSCWSFSTTGALEGRLYVKNKVLPNLSEQNLVDCARNVSGKGCCGGCNGGWMTDAYDYVRLNGGIDTGASYAYEAKQSTCRYNAANKAGTATGYAYSKQDDEAALKVSLMGGPVATAVDATEWQTYKSGVFKCQNFTGLNHGVLIVGYGTDATAGDYWTVKNSWGTSWGEQGYIRVKRNAGNACGIASAANYPTV